MYRREKIRFGATQTKIDLKFGVQICDERNKKNSPFILQKFEQYINKKVSISIFLVEDDPGFHFSHIVCYFLKFHKCLFLSFHAHHLRLSTSSTYCLCHLHPISTTHALVISARYSTRGLTPLCDVFVARHTLCLHLLLLSQDLYILSPAKEEVKATSRKRAKVMTMTSKKGPNPHSGNKDKGCEAL